MNPKTLFCFNSEELRLDNFSNGKSEWEFDFKCKDKNNEYPFHVSFIKENETTIAAKIETQEIECKPLVVFQFVIHDASGAGERNIIKRFSMTVLSKKNEVFQIHDIKDTFIFTDSSIAITITIKGITSIFTVQKRDEAPTIPSPKRILQQQQEIMKQKEKKQIKSSKTPATNKAQGLIKVEETDNDESDFPTTQLRSILTQIPIKDHNDDIEYDFVSDIAEKNFVGLVNQGTTCYLNTLLQILYNLPAFRLCVYTCTSHADMIRELQSLFCCLEYSKYAVPTKKLTEAFGWSMKETIEQQDYHEFSNVFFDALKKALGSSIQFLFQGRIRSFIRCRNISYSSETYDDFIDISLDVLHSSTFESSMEFYLQRSTLTGDNKYDCGPEYRKQEADIGIEIVDLPRVLTFHLQRFLYDAETGKTIKINNEFKYRKTINMHPFVSETDIHSSQYTKDYELFGVVAHNGTTESGHYYAFIRPYICSNNKSIKDRWYKFNDTSVEVSNDTEAIDGNFGGPKKTYSAYVLYYVRRDSINDIFYNPFKRIFASNARVIPQPIKEASAKIAGTLKTQHELYSAGYSFKLVSTESLYESAGRGIMSWSLPKASIECARKSTIDDLFDIISMKTEIEKNKLRVFGIMCSYCLGSEITSMNTINGLLRYEALFVTTKDEFSITDYRILVPVFLYIPKIKDPLRFLWIEKRSINDSISSLFPRVNEECGKGKLQAYIARGSIEAECVANPLESFKTNYVKNGTIFVLEYIEFNDDNQVLPNVMDLNRINTFSAIDTCKYRYYTEFKKRFPSSFANFLSFRQMSECIRIRTPNNIHDKVYVPKNIKFQEFRNFIAAALNIQYNSCSDTMLLYANDSKTQIIETTGDFTVIGALREMRFTGEVVPIAIPFASQDSFTNTLRMVIKITQRESIVLDEFSFIVPREWTCADIVAVGVTKRWFSDNSTVRVVTQSPDLILTSHPMQQKLADIPNPVRIDILTDFMKVIGEDEEEISVVFCERDNGRSTLHNKGCPFIFQVNLLETVGEIKARIIEYINGDKEAKTKKRVCKSLLLYNPRTREYTNIQDEEVLCDIMDVKTQLLCIECPSSHCLIRKQPLA